MSSRPAYKQTEVGEIPEEWDMTEIESICDILDSQRIPLNEEVRRTMKGEIPYYGANGLVDHVNDYIFEGKLILVAEDGGYFDEYTTRPIAYLVNGKCWVNNHAHVLKVREGDGYSTEYIFYSLEHRNLMPFIKGSTRPKLNQKELREIPIPIPPLPEQKKIASILSTVDDAIQKTDEIIAKTERLKKGLMQRLLTSGIGHREFKDTEIGKIPKDWEVMKLGNAITYVKGKKPKGMTEEHQREYFPYLSAEYLRNNKITKFVEPSQDVILVNEGDLILLWDGSNAGEFFWGKQGILSSTMVRIEQEKPSYDQKFLFYLLKAKESFLKGQTKGTGIPHVNENVLNNLVIPDPPLGEQQKIAEILSTVDEQIEKERAKKGHLEQLKKGLMQVLLTGKVRVKVN
jgi:type I restriction enzyme S subunit